MAAAQAVEAVLIDTDVFSYLMKQGDRRARIYQERLKGKLHAVSFITVGELLFGAFKKKWGAGRMDDLRVRLRSVVIVPYDFALCTTYGRVKADMQSAGAPMADNDLWIAACALRHAIPLATNNRKHFEQTPGSAQEPEPKKRT